MSSGYTGGVPDLYSEARRAAPGSNATGGYDQFSGKQPPFSFRLPILAGEQEMSGQIRRGDFMGKRALMEFQQNQQAMEFYTRNVKMRPTYQHAFPNPGPELLPEFSNPRYGFPILRQQRTILNGNFSAPVGIQSPLEGIGRVLEVSNQEKAEKSLMNHRLQELERKLLDDEDDGEAVSVVTESEWSDAIRDLIGPIPQHISPSPTSSSSSCTSTSASQPPLCSKQALIEAAVAISEGKPESGNDILTRLLQEVSGKSNFEKKIVDYMVPALKSRIESAVGTNSMAVEIRSEFEHILYRVCPCFMLGFFAANLAILEAKSELCLEKIHVLDFELGQGGQYIHLINTLAANAKVENKAAAFLTITAFPYAGVGKESLQTVGEELRARAMKLNVILCFHIRDFNINELSRENLEINADEALAVNFAFTLHKLPDESVTVDNLRDELLRRVKTMSPAVVTVVEQELNTNTAPLITRVRDAFDYYATVLECLDSIGADHPDRTKLDQGVRQKLTNSIACDGRERVERCEVHGKWRARLNMAGFQPLVASSRAADSLRAKLNASTRVNPGFTVSVDAGGICFGWRGKTLAFASAWR